MPPRSLIAALFAYWRLWCVPHACSLRGRREGRARQRLRMFATFAAKAQDMVDNEGELDEPDAYDNEAMLEDMRKKGRFMHEVRAHARA